ncbi:MAG: metallophosphoesterase [Pseudomonadota bacterium]|nr:metallophosphoesterase [Pseudomonadota bacterium]
MLIAQLSDTHIQSASSDHPMAAARADNLRRSIADINRQGVDAVIHTGDSVQHGLAEEYAQLREILGELEAPLFLIPGNRDRHEALKAAFGHFSYLPKDDDFLHYVVEDYPVRLIGLDTTAAGERKGAFCAARRAWLEEALAQRPDKPTLLFLHHPPFDIAEPRYVHGYCRPQEAEDLAAVVGRHPQVRGLFCGHVHFWHHASWAGTTAVTMPSVAADLRIGTDAATDTASLYFLHSVADDGTVVSRARIAAD